MRSSCHAAAGAALFLLTAACAEPAAEPRAAARVSLRVRGFVEAAGIT